MLVLADILNNLRLVTQLGIIFKTLYEFSVIDEYNPNEICQTGISMFSFKLRNIELKSMWNVSKFFFVGLYQINDAFDIPMDVVIVGRIQVSPEYVLLVQHQPEKLE